MDDNAIFTHLPSVEVERRRLASVAELRERDRAEWQQRYQEHCDRLYWTHGQCCAGCDHWQSESGETGRCLAAGILSGEDVLRSMGVTFSSYTPPPGPPFTAARDYCGRFSDEFDWSTLNPEYLGRIGAMRQGRLRAKPPFSRRQETGSAAGPSC